MNFRNIPIVFVILPWKEINFKIIPDCDTLAINLKPVFHNILWLKVERCGMQLFGDGDITGERPEPCKAIMERWLFPCTQGKGVTCPFSS